MSKSALTVNKLNFKNLKVPYFITGITFAALLVQDIVQNIVGAFNRAAEADNHSVSIGNMLWLLIILAPIFIPALNLRRITNLGGKRKSFFIGNIWTYIILAAGVSLVSTIIYYTYDSLIENLGFIGKPLNAIEAFGWSSHVAVIAFIQQFAFLLLFAAFVHTLTAIQDKWYGWTADIVIVAIISVFTPIKPLRDAEVWFFNMIIFHSNAFVQIISCLVLAAVIYAVSLPVINRKRF
ncbi:MAG: hypothetical protein FWD71_08600 [Oscillospiraceae bacterium]|nr:hypothetical protein [Oscillospiraceae bacterium]